MRFHLHKYLGPGNKLNLGEPIDEDDRIALVHNIHYNLAKTNQDIRRADKEAILSFYSNFLNTGNWHSVIGGTGISVKYAIESISGIVYPNLMSTSTTRKPNKITHRGHSLYAARQRELSNLFKLYKLRGELYRDFCRRIKEDDNIRVPGVENTIDEPIAGNSGTTTFNNPKFNNFENRNIIDNEFNFDNIFNMDDNQMDIQNDNNLSLSNTTGNGQVLMDQELLLVYIVEYTTDVSAPMKPTGSTEFKAENLITRFYKDDACAIMGVPINNPYFMCISLNKGW
ncbi:hypothetical protein FQA39_LY16006 [Lamprigera yunnana]|nr:hypothetical protein FQA39_LY16006 [Lamprigera yunnana]